MIAVAQVHAIIPADVIMPRVVLRNFLPHGAAELLPKHSSLCKTETSYINGKEKKETREQTDERQ